MIRDDELNRLVKYAQGQGVKVIFSSVKTQDHAAWTLDGTEITIYQSQNLSKTEKILSMIHELGHHAWFIHEKNRQPDLKFEEAITRQDQYEEKIKDLPTPKKLRKKILDIERAGTQYWYTIYKETNMKFPLWKLFAQMEHDVWQYEYLYKHGEFPKRPLRRAMWKEFKAKHIAKVYE